MIERTCEHCAATFTTGRIMQRFCTERCRKRSEHRRADARRRAAVPPRSVVVPRGVCRDCGTTENMDWSAHHGSASTGTKTRCRQCWNARCAAVYHERKALGLYTYAPKQRPVRTCATCQAFFEVRGRQRSSVRCEPCQYRFDVERRGEFFARRRKVMRMGARDISWQTVGERDGWTCHLCAEPVKQSADSPHDPQSPTVDHIVPIAAGGKHEWSNVALAHWLCNVTRGAKPLAAG